MAAVTSALSSLRLEITAAGFTAFATSEPRRHAEAAALFRSNINPYDIFRLDKDKRFALSQACVLPAPHHLVDGGERTGSRA